MKASEYLNRVKLANGVITMTHEQYKDLKSNVEACEANTLEDQYILHDLFAGGIQGRVFSLLPELIEDYCETAEKLIKAFTIVGANTDLATMLDTAAEMVSAYPKEIARHLKDDYAE